MTADVAALRRQAKLQWFCIAVMAALLVVQTAAPFKGSATSDEVAPARHGRRLQQVGAGRGRRGETVASWTEIT